MSKEHERPKKPLWCARCHGIIYANDKWKVSWFKNEEICTRCADEEDRIKGKLLEAGEDLKDYEGCGYLPEV